MTAARANALPPLDVLQRYNIDEACAYLRIARVTLYRHIAAGRLLTVHDGRRHFVPGEQIAALSRSSDAAA